MAELTTTTGSGAQTSTQSPQTSAAASGAASTESSSGLQPGTTTSLLQSHDGITLTPTALTTVQLNASTQVPTTGTTTAPRHINGGLLAFSILLFIAAVTLFWTTGRSVNKTTK